MEEKNYRNMCIVLIFSVCSVLVLSGLIITNYFMNGRLLAKVDCACTKCDVKDNGTVSDDGTVSGNVVNESTNFCDKTTTNECNNTLFSLIGLGRNYILDSDSNIRTVSDKISLVRFSKYADVEVVNGGLVFNIHNYTIDEDTKGAVLGDSETITYNIPNESIKYIYTYYDQPSGSTVIYALTESGNLYRSIYKHFSENYDFNSVINFSLTNSNVTDLKLVDKTFINESGSESIVKDIAAVINGETIQLSKWD